ncbi:MAG: hypothetical protein ACRDXE_04895 [Acidimicrobiales bacterium]
MNTTTEPVEVAFFTPGKGWGRRTFKTEAAMQAWAARQDEDVEIRVAQ